MARSPVAASWPKATCSKPSGTISSSGRGIAVTVPTAPMRPSGVNGD